MFAKYGWIVIGITCGFAAKYALLLKRGVKVKLRLVAADLLLLPMVALIAYSMVSRAGASAEIAALLTAFCTVGADRLIKLLTERFFLQVQAATLRDLNARVLEESGELRQTVAKVNAAESLAAQSRGERPIEGDDTGGRLARRMPPLKGTDAP
ncbi:hypothetical protein [Sphingomonas koreensis]